MEANGETSIIREEDQAIAETGITVKSKLDIRAEQRPLHMFDKKDANQINQTTIKDFIRPSKANVFVYDQEAPCRTSKKNQKKNLVMYETLCKKSKDDLNNTGLQEANMAAEDTNSRPNEEEHVEDRDISTSTENDNITMNDITAEEGREDKDFTTNIGNDSITSDKQLKNRWNNIRTQI